MTDEKTQDQYDSPWKELLERYFREFLEFFFPEAAEGIDWERGHEFLDKEFQQAVRDAELGKRLADKLAKVWQKNGDETWLLAHTEIQGQYEPGFSERMFVYNYRIFDRHRKPVVSLAVLADQRPAWKPKPYGYELWGFSITMEFPVVKLNDYRKQWNELEKSRNPFAVAVMAHLKTQETRNDDESRRKWKLRLIRELYDRGHEREDVINLFRFIDWVMKLPGDMEDDLWEEVCRVEEEKKMPYVTSVEKIGFRRGFEQARREGLLETIQTVLSVKFSVKGLRLMAAIQAIDDPDRLNVIKEAVKVAHDLAEIEEMLIQ
ncbi:hypothetical protein [Desulfonema magnum]|uniref:Transposase n=1 Tax=Desulfonema magnum TaxID=45655 RepID=A0A975BV30_9BACT|nr:hypothetical protein [Desulfonema magnum]QTA91764.1 Uncharacterized protein dnm_078380 [Desulfonema magnum]